MDGRQEIEEAVEKKYKGAFCKYTYPDGGIIHAIVDSIAFETALGTPEHIIRMDGRRIVTDTLEDLEIKREPLKL